MFLFLFLLLCLTSCAQDDPLAGLETLALPAAGSAGPDGTNGSGTSGSQAAYRTDGTVLVDLPDASVVLPPGWDAARKGAWPVLVVLHGISRNGYGMSRDPVWSRISAQWSVVLVFPQSDGPGWDEAPESGDRRRVASILESLRNRRWCRPQALVLFGWSAGSVLASDILGANKGRNGSPLADRLVLYSGFMGYWLERVLRENPGLEGIQRVPVLLVCGKKEGQDDLGRMAGLLEKTGFDYRILTHPDAHSLRDDMVEKAVAWAFCEGSKYP